MCVCEGVCRVTEGVVKEGGKVCVECSIVVVQNSVLWFHV